MYIIILYYIYVLYNIYIHTHRVYPSSVAFHPCAQSREALEFIMCEMVNHAVAMAPMRSIFGKALGRKH